MKFPTLILFLLPISLLAQDLTPVDPQTLLNELAAIEAKSETAVSARRKAALDQISRGATSKEAALDFFLDAQMATQFQGVNRENTQFRDWRKREEGMLKNNDFAESIRLHLYYLSLTLRKAQGEKDEVLVPLVADYLNVLEKSKDAIETRGSLLKASVTDSLFTRWLNLGADLSKIGEWETNPGNADRIAARFLLPLWRKEKNPALLTWWDARIARESAKAGTSQLNFEESTFSKITRPSLQWQRTQELVILGQPNRAKTEMLTLIKTYPTHPNIADWIKTLRGLLTPGPEKSAPPTAPVNAG